MTTKRRLLVAAVIISTAVLAVLVAMMLSPKNSQQVRLIPAVTTHTAPAGTSWGQTTYPLSHFYRTWLSHRTCGQSLSGEVRGRHGRYTQHFQHCTMTQDAVVVAYAPKPGPVPTRTPQPQPRPTTPPQPTFAPVPTPTPDTSSPERYLLGLMNRDRAARGVSPLTLDTKESGCALDHAKHMASQGAISHDQFPADICIPYRSAGENVGSASYGSALAGIDAVHQGMMAETGWTPGCTSSHICNILNYGYTRVGLGVFWDGSTVWISEEFVG